MKVDDVIARYGSARGVKLIVQRLHDDDDPVDLILIEGSRKSLRFLAELLIAVADDTEDDGFQFGPKTSGNAYFSKKSDLGLYLYRTGTHRPPPDISR